MFKIFLFLAFSILIMLCLDMDLFEFILFETLHFLGLYVYFFSQISGDFHYFFQQVSNPFFPVFSFCNSYSVNIGDLNVIPEVS